MNTPVKHVAKYATLAHYPQPNRTEHVNIGLVVFLPDGAVRLHLGQDLRKLRCIDPSADLAAARSWEESLPRLLHGMTEAQARTFLRNFGQWSISTSTGCFAYTDEASYLARIACALQSLVAPPKTKRQDRSLSTRLHLDLKAAFHAKGWLGKNIDNHDIVERYPIGPMTTAEFALKNGTLHVIETLDLRTSNPSSKRSDARATALTLDMATKASDSAPQRYCVLAGIDSPLMPEAKDLMQHYSEHVITWENVHEMNDLLGMLGQATGKPGIPMPLPPH